MQKFEYKAVPAPHTGKSGKGVKGTPAKFANHLTQVINEMAAEGWEYLRADTLPCDERSGLTSKVSKFQNVLVFRRELVAPAPVVAPAPKEEKPVRIIAEAARVEEETPARSALRAIKPEEETVEKPASDLTAH
jgi:hypothetical protein